MRREVVLKYGCESPLEGVGLDHLVVVVTDRIAADEKGTYFAVEADPFGARIQESVPMASHMRLTRPLKSNEGISPTLTTPGQKLGEVSTGPIRWAHPSSSHNTR
jgi:hypothetical protein